MEGPTMSKRGPSWISIFLIVNALFNSACNCLKPDSYENIQALRQKTVEMANHSRQLRPLLNQSETIVVSIAFSLVSLVELDDVDQKFVVNGFLDLRWKNELISWDTKEYATPSLLVSTEDIWKPRLMLVNTVADEDPIHRISTIFIGSKGGMTWIPGGLFASSCQLQLSKYPFDKQECFLQFCSVGEFNTTVRYEVAETKIDQTFFIPNRGWDLHNATVFVDDIAFLSGTGAFSCPTFKFEIKRRPTFFVLYIIIPIILMSFLNVLVFTIPADSGEKISYGITVLLGLSVFMSTISSMLPSATDAVPAVTIYLFFLLIGSVLSVAVAIATVVLQTNEEAIEMKEKNDVTAQDIINDKTGSAHIFLPSRKVSNGSIREGSISSNRKYPWSRRCWLLKKLIQYANTISLVVFIFMWCTSTLLYFAYVAE